MSHHVPTIDILGVRVACLDPQQALDEASKLYERDAPGWIAVENAHALNIAYSDPSHRDVLNRADLVLNDGKGVMLAARILGRSFPADLHGNVFSPLLLERAANQGWPVFFLGAAPGVAERAAATLAARLPDLQVVGTHDGFIAAGEEESVAEKIRSSGTGLLMVGLGMPLQEQWLDRHLVKTGARLGCTVGAFYDFQAGEIPRAPAWMNRMGLEWLYRLAHEPRRLWRRYLIGNPAFVYRVLGQRLRSRR